jgi:hypothetical protein
MVEIGQPWSCVQYSTYTKPLHRIRSSIIEGNAH